jgi:hypothetical protein
MAENGGRPRDAVAEPFSSQGSTIRSASQRLGRILVNAFRLLLVVIFVAISGYTLVVIGDHGMGLLAVFFGDMMKLGWPGQFNLDFLCMLALSGLWVAWRHQFSPAGLVLAVVAFFGGALFLSVYLFVESVRVGGDSRALLLGSARAAS